MLGKKNPSEKEFRNFLALTAKLEPMEFMGLVRLMNVDIFKDDEEKTPKEFEEVFSEVLDRYIQSSASHRKKVMKILKAAVQEKD